MRGYTSIAKIRRDNVIYVDKTSYVSTLAKNRARPVFLTRPRRFGKSLLVSVFASLVFPWPQGFCRTCHC